MRRLGITFCISFLNFWLSHAFATTEVSVFNMPRDVTPISHQIYDLHRTIFWICIVIGVVVFGLLIYSMFKHHKPTDITQSNRVEITWMVVPSLILIGMAIPALIILMRMDHYSKADVNIKITGYPWKWRYDYRDQKISVFSHLIASTQNQRYLLHVEKPIVVPIHQKIRFLITSNDVIHSWWAPALGIKHNTIPGFIHETWARIDKPGIYQGQCTQQCGLSNAYRPIVVDARTQEDFLRWVLEQTHAT